jgi:hypothetical protein
MHRQDSSSRETEFRGTVASLGETPRAPWHLDFERFLSTETISVEKSDTVKRTVAHATTPGECAQ